MLDVVGFRSFDDVLIYIVKKQVFEICLIFCPYKKS